jgi:hypothetical protein
MTKFRSLCWLSFFNTSEAVAQSTGLSRWMTESVWSEGLCAEGILQAKTWREKASASGEPRLWHLSGFPQFSIINYLFLGTPTYTTFFWQSSRGSDLLAENGKSFQHETSPSLVTLAYQVTIQEWEWVPEEVLWVGWVGLEATGWSIRGFPRDWTKVLPQFLPWFTHPSLNILRPGRVEEKHFPKWPTWWATAFNIFNPVGDCKDERGFKKVYQLSQFGTQVWWVSAAKVCKGCHFFSYLGLFFIMCGCPSMGHSQIQQFLIIFSKITRFFFPYRTHFKATDLLGSLPRSIFLVLITIPELFRWKRPTNLTIWSYYHWSGVRLREMA